MPSDKHEAMKDGTILQIIVFPATDFQGHENLGSQKPHKLKPDGRLTLTILNMNRNFFLGPRPPFSLLKQTNKF